MSKAYDIDELTKIINDAGIAAEAVDISRSDGERRGIQLGDGDIRPVIYPEDLNPAVTEESIDKFIEFVKDCIKMGEDETSRLKSIVLDFEEAKDRLRVCLTRKASDGFDKFVHRDFLDMTQYVRMIIDDTMSARVTKGQLEIWNITEDELFDIALNNIEYDSISMNSVLSAMTGMDEDEIPSPGMYVCSCGDRLYGATAMCNTDVLDEVSSKIGTNNIVILPSSVHEVIAVSAIDADIEGLKTMVSVVNDAQVAPADQLSDNVYIYNSDTKELKVA